MKKLDVVIQLEKIREAKEKWGVAHGEFTADVADMMRRLLPEAAVNFMSAEEIAKAGGFTTKKVREMMRYAGLDPKKGKRLLSKTAAEALATNSALMGIEPHEMDLMSPLAYLPMGEKMKRELQDKRVSQVHEVEPEVSGNEALYERLADAFYDAMPWEGETYQAVAETLALRALAELGICSCGESMPCLTCGHGL